MLTGFGSHFESEAVAGALPVGRNSPQHVPFGLYAEQLSGTAFTAPRHENRRSWLYRLRPAAVHSPFEPYNGAPLLRSAPFASAATPPNRLRWDPIGDAEPADFIDGLVTYGGNGDPAVQTGIAIHLFAVKRNMQQRVFTNADGELLIVPQSGTMVLRTEFGVIAVSAGSIAVIPRGIRFAVDLPEGEARGYVCENFGAPFRLPELGPIGSNSLANPRDFEYPSAAFEDRDRPTTVIQKFNGRLWQVTLPWSPLDVVAWHGNLAPYRYDLSRFNAVNTVTFDHCDPSIFTVLTSPSELPGTANCDFVIFPPRWSVADDTFRPPWFHRNVMSEFMGLVRGAYDAKGHGFRPGGASLHNCMSGHGPDRQSYEAAIAAELGPQRISGTLAVMFESRWIIHPTAHALRSPLLQTGYDNCWSGMRKAMI